MEEQMHLITVKRYKQLNEKISEQTIQIRLLQENTKALKQIIDKQAEIIRKLERIINAII